MILFINYLCRITLSQHSDSFNNELPTSALRLLFSKGTNKNKYSNSSNMTVLFGIVAKISTLLL